MRKRDAKAAGKEEAKKDGAEAKEEKEEEVLPVMRDPQGRVIFVN